MTFRSTEKPCYGSVLIVDDEPAVSIVLREHLKNAGFEAEEVYTFDDAVNEIQRRRFNFIIIDIHLGKKTGEDIIAVLRGGKNPNEKTPIIVMSSQLKTEIIQRVKSRVSGIFVKPLDFDALAKRLRQMVYAPKNQAA
jgi:DNA-binding response OmpR family regulator